MILGLNMDRPLLVSGVLDYAAGFHTDVDVVSAVAGGAPQRLGWGLIDRRARMLATALADLGVGSGDRVATIAWNDHRHLEAYFAVPGMGGILHTANPRLHEDQLAYVIDHAEDGVVLIDSSLVPLAHRIAPRTPTVRHWVVFGSEVPAGVDLPGAVDYETLIAGRDEATWSTFDERAGAMLCYTSGTTGRPKGVLFSHRALLLQLLRAASPDAFGIAAADTILQIPPMFHANAWGLPYLAAMQGARLVLPGPDLSPEAVCGWIDTEQITFSGGIPTVWLDVVDHLTRTNGDLGNLRRLVLSGTVPPSTLVQRLEEDFGVEVRHQWGMTEMMVGAASGPTHALAQEPATVQRQRKAKSGRTIFGVELEIIDAEGVPLEHDGERPGELIARGPWVAGAYYRMDPSDTHTPDGWFRTGDVATLTADGYLEIVDRTKDIIKSGGEWISSMQLERVAAACPGVAQAAVIGVAHPRWQERPLLLVRREDGSDVGEEDIRAHLGDQVARWWLPDQIIFLDVIPETAAKKVDKVALRGRFADHVLPT